MSDNILEEIVAESYRHEFEQFDNSPEHVFSLKHRFAMKRIFSRYARNVEKNKHSNNKLIYEVRDNNRRLSIKQRLIVAVLIVFLMTMLVGWVIVYVSQNFSGTVHQNYTQLTAVNTDNCPQTIEYKYYLSEIPEDFVVIETTSSPFVEHTVYYNSSTNQTIDIMQSVKTSFRPNYNTEHNDLEEIEINGHDGLYIDFSDSEHYSSLLVWDNDDYIIEIGGDLPKSSIINLAKSTEVLLN